MLGDDIMDGTKRGVAIVAHAAKNVLKGALLFAAVVGGGYALGVLGLAVYEVGVAGLIGGAANASLAAGASNAVGYGSIAAIAGGAITGIASLFPGKDEGFSFRRSYRKLEEMGKGNGKGRSVEPETYTARDTSYSAPAPAYQPAPQPIIVQSPQSAPAPQAQPIIVHAQQPQQQQPIVIVQQPAPQPAAPLQLDVQTASVPAAIETQPQTMSATTATTGDNPYFRPGKGAELMQRGNEAQSTLSK